MSGVAVAPDLESIEALDFDPDVACEALRDDPRCPNPARWVVICRSCGHAPAYCDAHLKNMHAMARIYPLMRCRVCGHMAATIKDLVRIVPVKGGDS